MRTIVLIACSKGKRAKPAPARDLYTSQLYRKSLRYAMLQEPDAIYVLSARHGLLPIDRIVAPYDETLNAMPRDDTRAWARRILASLRSVADPERDRFIFLAGEMYRRDLVPHLTNVDTPM